MIWNATPGKSNRPVGRGGLIRAWAVVVFLIAVAPGARAQMFEPETEPQADRQIPHYDAEGEFLRSVLLPGWSQFRQGHDNRGVGYAAVAAISAVFMAGLVETPFVADDKDNFGRVLSGLFYGFNAVASGFDAYQLARSSNRENGWELGGRVRANSPPGFRVALLRIAF